MKKTAFILAAILSCLFLFNAPGEAADLGKEIGQGILDLSVVSIREQMTLDILCGYYYLKNGKWPRDRQEFTAFYEKLDEESQKEVLPLLQSFMRKESDPKPESVKEYMDFLSKLLDYELTPLDNGDLLIEGGFNKELAKESSKESSILDGFRFSVVAHKTEEGFSFSPSDKAKQATGYFNVPFKFKAENPPETKPAP